MSKKKSLILLLISAAAACVCIYCAVKTKNVQFLPGEYGEKVSQDYRWVFRLLLSSSIGVFLGSLYSPASKESGIVSEACKMVVFAAVSVLLFVGAMYLMQYRNVTDFYICCCMNAVFTYILVQYKKVSDADEACSEMQKNVKICNIVILGIFAAAFIMSLLFEMPRIKYGQVYSFRQLILFGTVAVSALYAWVCPKNQNRFLPLCVSVIIGAAGFGVSLFTEFQIMEKNGYSTPTLICYPVTCTVIAVELFNVYRIVCKRICLSKENL